MPSHKFWINLYLLSILGRRELSVRSAFYETSILVKVELATKQNQSMEFSVL